VAEQRQTNLSHQPSPTKIGSSPAAIASQPQPTQVLVLSLRQKLAQMLAEEDEIYKKQIIDMQETPEQIRERMARRVK
jgi:hypothetical protein